MWRLWRLLTRVPRGGGAQSTGAPPPPPPGSFAPAAHNLSDPGPRAQRERWLSQRGAVPPLAGAKAPLDLARLPPNITQGQV